MNWAFLAIGLGLGVVTGTLASLAEAGLLLDPRRTRAPALGEHLHVLAIISNIGLPFAIVAILLEPIGIIAYFAASSVAFVVGMAVMCWIWVQYTRSP